MTPSLDSGTMYYFDTNALWKFYQDQKGDMNIQRLVARSQSQVLISPLTLLEFFGVLMKYYRKKSIRRRDVHAIAKRVRRDSTVGKSNRPFQVIQVPDGSFREAEGILLQYGNSYDLQTNDVLHLAIVVSFQNQLATSLALVTSDHVLKNVAQRKGVIWYDPETTE